MCGVYLRPNSYVMRGGGGSRKMSGSKLDVFFFKQKTAYEITV